MILYRRNKKIRKFAGGGSFSTYATFAPSAESTNKNTSGSLGATGSSGRSGGGYRKPGSPKNKTAKFAEADKYKPVGTVGMQDVAGKLYVDAQAKLSKLNPDDPNNAAEINRIQVDYKNKLSLIKKDQDLYDKAVKAVGSHGTKTNSLDTYAISGNSVYYTEKDNPNSDPKLGSISEVFSNPKLVPLTNSRVLDIKNYASPSRFSSFANSEMPLQVVSSVLSSSNFKHKLKEQIVNKDNGKINSDYTPEELADEFGLVEAGKTIDRTNTPALMRVFSVLLDTVSNDSTMYNSLQAEAVTNLTKKEGATFSKEELDIEKQRVLVDYLKQFAKASTAAERKGKSGKGGSGGDESNASVKEGAAAEVQLAAESGKRKLGDIVTTGKTKSHIAGVELNLHKMNVLRNNLQTEADEHFNRKDGADVLSVTNSKTLGKYIENDALYTVEGKKISKEVAPYVFLDPSVAPNLVPFYPYMKDDTGNLVPAIELYSTLSAKLESKIKYFKKNSKKFVEETQKQYDAWNKAHPKETPKVVDTRTVMENYMRGITTSILKGVGDRNVVFQPAMLIKANIGDNLDKIKGGDVLVNSDFTSRDDTTGVMHKRMRDKDDATTDTWFPSNVKDTWVVSKMMNPSLVQLNLGQDLKINREALNISKVAAQNGRSVTLTEFIDYNVKTSGVEVGLRNLIGK